MPDPVINELTTIASQSVGGVLVAGVVLFLREMIDRSHNGKDVNKVNAETCAALREGMAKDITHIKESMTRIEADQKDILRRMTDRVR